MFKRPTVFILGAGASWHYGYPTGEVLITKVIEKAKLAREIFKQTSETKMDVSLQIIPKIVESHEVSQQDTHPRSHAQWEAAWKECDDLIERLQLVNPLVIDYFLGWNPELSAIGRMMIAWVILECEERYFREKYNFNRNGRPSIDKDDWYRFILSKLVSGYINPSNLLENKIDFITFNYDTSLERYLYRGLNSYTPMKSFIQAFVENFPVIHIYGKIHENVNADPKPYSMQIPNKVVKNLTEYTELTEYYRRCKDVLDRAYDASTLIKTIHPGSKDDNKDMIGRAQRVVREAECIYILGYGFDENNSKRIGLDQQRNSGVMTQIMFTNLDSSNRVTKLASRLFFRNPDALSTPQRPTFALGNLSCEISTRDVYGAFEFDFDSMEER
jgi:hypothetical protein